MSETERLRATLNRLSGPDRAHPPLDGGTGIAAMIECALSDAIPRSTPFKCGYRDDISSAGQ